VALSVRLERPGGGPAFKLPYDGMGVVFFPRGDTRRVVLRSEGDAPQLLQIADFAWPWDWA
jgi:hypothetical protein